MYQALLWKNWKLRKNKETSPFTRYAKSRDPNHYQHVLVEAIALLDAEDKVLKEFTSP